MTENKRTRHFWKCSAVLLLWMMFAVVTLMRPAWATSYDEDKDPVKTTQTDPVAVTKELLTAGETGPSSPTYKVKDTAQFLIKPPYERAEAEEKPKKSKKAAANWWEGWLFWEKDGKNSSKSVTD